MSGTLWHGTRAGFKRGGLLLPGDQVGKDNYSLGRSDAVYLTTDFDQAKGWAFACRGRGRPKVLEVKPLAPLSVDESTVNGDEHDGYRTSAARVVRVAWIEERP